MTVLCKVSLSGMLYETVRQYQPKNSLYNHWMSVVFNVKFVFLPQFSRYCVLVFLTDFPEKEYLSGCLNLGR